MSVVEFAGGFSFLCEVWCNTSDMWRVLKKRSAWASMMQWLSIYVFICLYFVSLSYKNGRSSCIDRNQGKGSSIYNQSYKLRSYDEDSFDDFSCSTMFWGSLNASATYLVKYAMLEVFFFFFQSEGLGSSSLRMTTTSKHLVLVIQKLDRGICQGFPDFFRSEWVVLKVNGILPGTYIYHTRPPKKESVSRFEKDVDIRTARIVSPIFPPELK